ncbi:MAG: hypothetical protein PHT40_03055 [Patescibacteria group bacterium]|nr:hypothetical protein [Patescibacteria group bacterium]
MEQVKYFQTDGKAAAHERKVNKWLTKMGNNIKITERFQRSETTDTEHGYFAILTTIFYHEVKRKK